MCGWKWPGLDISNRIRSRQAEWTSGENMTTGQFRSTSLMWCVVFKFCVSAFDADVSSLLHQGCNAVTVWLLIQSQIRINEGTQQPRTSSASWPGLSCQSSNVNGQCKIKKTGQSSKWRHLADTRRRSCLLTMTLTLFRCSSQYHKMGGKYFYWKHVDSSVVIKLILVSEKTFKMDPFFRSYCVMNSKRLHKLRKVQTRGERPTDFLFQFTENLLSWIGSTIIYLAPGIGLICFTKENDSFLSYNIVYWQFVVKFWLGCAQFIMTELESIVLLSELSRHVFVMAIVTQYGSQFADGRRSSK